MINSRMLKNAVISGANNICLQKAKINDLNIFPVPDGDTGTNMSMTITAAKTELEKKDFSAISDVSAKTASSMLRGARGNSGVILSLLFRGFAKGLEGKEEADGLDLVKALGLGVDAAYKAVMKPTEGTILTVARVAYEKGLTAAMENRDVVYVWQEVCEAAYDALDTTPELLPVLKKAGVVDAGGKGLCVIFDGMLSVFADGKVIEYDPKTEEKSEEDEFRSAAAEFDDDINFTYCTEFIVGRDPEIKTEPNELRLFLETIGDCVVVVDDEEIIKVHVHTEKPGDALNKGLEFGSLLTVKVENMKEQHKAAKEESKKSAAAEEKEHLEPAEPTEDYGFVAVAAGEGVVELFKDLGCQYVVSGGQSMNPSTDDIYEAVMATPAKTVFVLPNNKNIVMAAEQTASIVTDRNVIVLPTKTIPQGLTAMLSFDPEMNPESNKEVIMDAASGVSSGSVTFAARDSEFGGKKIKAGDIIALENGRLSITEKTPVKAVYKLIKQMVDKNTSFVTIIWGEGISEEEALEAEQLVRNKFSNVDVTLVKGDQPVYYFIVGVE